MSDQHRVQHLHKVFRIRSSLIVGIVSLSVAVSGCHKEDARRLQLDTTQDATHRSGPWIYEYTIAQKGTRSEGYHGKLLHEGKEVPDPANVNDFYETPWGPLYWVGRPVVLFGRHGWMPNPLEREPQGQALTDPAKLCGQTFSARVKVLTCEPLGTPDRLETDPKVLAALKSFDLKEVHVQGDWFGVSKDWVALHDTKRWGRFEMRMAEPEGDRPLALEFRNTGDFKITTSSQTNSLAALAPPDRLGHSEFVKLPPQVGAVRAIRCTLDPIVGDSLDLFLVCHVEGSRRRP